MSVPRRATIGRARSAARELRPMASLTLAEGGSRLLSFAFYLLAAHTLTTAGFGEVRYTITLSALAFAVGQVVVTGLARELGAARGDADRTGAVLGSSLAAAAVVVGASAVVAAAAVAAGALPGANALGLLVTLGGLAVFQLYYGIGRGIGESLRPALTYVGGSLAQLVVFAAIALVADPGPTIALVVYGLASVVPVAWLEATRPVVRGRDLRVDRATLARLWRIGAPLLVAAVGYLVWLSADQIWVATTMDRHDVGLYGAAKTLAQLFIVLPAGVGGVLLPRIAELVAGGRDRAARHLAWGSTAGVLGLSAALAVVVAAFRGDLLAALFGAPYRAAAPALGGLVVGMTLYAGFATLTTAAVGWGRPRAYAFGVAVAAAVELTILLAAGGDSIATAAWASAAAIGAGFAAVLALLALRPLRRDD
jgi:O-antigen/teichoic acid export membrane protein